MKPLLFAFLALIGVSGVVQAQTYPTIVGEWYDIGIGSDDCGTPWSVHISPMTMVGAEVYCEFVDVERDAWMVRWKGTCGGGNEEWPVVIVATENPTNSTLSISYSTGVTNTMKSCKPR